MCTVHTLIHELFLQGEVRPDGLDLYFGVYLCVCVWHFCLTIPSLFDLALGLCVFLYSLLVVVSLIVSVSAIDYLERLVFEWPVI